MKISISLGVLLIPIWCFSHYNLYVSCGIKRNACHGVNFTLSVKRKRFYDWTNQDFDKIKPWNPSLIHILWMLLSIYISNIYIVICWYRQLQKMNTCNWKLTFCSNVKWRLYRFLYIINVSNISIDQFMTLLKLFLINRLNLIIL